MNIAISIIKKISSFNVRERPIRLQIHVPSYNLISNPINHIWKPKSTNLKSLIFVMIF